MTYATISRDARSYRLTSIDMLRGLVIVIMAIDHVRDFFMVSNVQDPMAQPDVPPGLYLTRWVTHFCAPVFVFLAGTSAGLMAGRKSRHELAAFLAKRGLWLVFVEVAIISTAYTFSPFEGVPEVGGQTLLALQVIWAIGASMVVLAGAQYLGVRTCAVIGAAIVLGHNAFDAIWPRGDLLAGNDPLWYGLETQSSASVGPFLLVFAYPLVPWIGVMLLGYGTAGIFKRAPKERDALLIKAGLAMIIGFFLLRASNLYGDPNLWQVQETGVLATIFDFMNVTKYPPSLLFLLITLGPMALLCAHADRMRGWLKDTLVMFGRVPFAFYIAHWYLIRLGSLALATFQGYEPEQMMTFFFFFPADYGVSLPWIYLVWLLVLAILYPFCKWFAELKTRRNDWWLSYL
jgi:uncharacterized membrane protein